MTTLLLILWLTLSAWGFVRWWRLVFRRHIPLGTKIQHGNQTYVYVKNVGAYQLDAGKLAALENERMNQAMSVLG